MLVCFGHATVSLAVLLAPAVDGRWLMVMLEGFLGGSFSLLRASTKAGLSVLYTYSASTANTFLNGTVAVPCVQPAKDAQPPAVRQGVSVGYLGAGDSVRGSSKHFPPPSQGTHAHLADVNGALGLRRHALPHQWDFVHTSSR